MILAGHFWILAAALVVDAVLGDPDGLWRRIPHPVALIGRLIEICDRLLNRERLSPAQKQVLGALAVSLLAVLAAVAGWAIEAILRSFAYGWLGTIVIVGILLAGRSLYDHVAAVASAYGTGGLETARPLVSKIVGRDPDDLDEAALGRAAIESAAENFSDGLVAPAFWFALLGLPGLLAYKAINTADSMIGHPSERYRDFGWAAARLDDIVNWPGARLSGLLIALAAPLVGGAVSGTIRTMASDAPEHRSPNAGWPEAAMAGALGVALGGPRHYRGVLADDTYLNAGGREARPADIRRALRVYAGAWALFFLAIVLIAVFFV